MTANIYQRLNQVMKEVEYIQKSEKTVNNSYRFVSHDQVTAKLHMPFVKAGIVVIPSVLEMKQDGNRSEIKLQVEFINIDDPKDRITTIHYGHGIDGGGTNKDGKLIPVGDKGIGKAISYAFKYAMLKTLMLETGDDPDNDANSAYRAVQPPVKELDEAILKLGIEVITDDPKLFDEYITYIKGFYREKDKDNWVEAMLTTINHNVANPQRFITSMEKWNAKRTEVSNG